MNKNILLCLFSLLNITLNAQSKKEQIIDLNYKIDSLTLITQSNKEKIISFMLIEKYLDLNQNESTLF